MANERGILVRHTSVGCSRHKEVEGGEGGCWIGGEEGKWSTGNKEEEGHHHDRGEGGGEERVWLSGCAEREREKGFVPDEGRRDISHVSVHTTAATCVCVCAKVGGGGGDGRVRYGTWQIKRHSLLSFFPRPNLNSSSGQTGSPDPVSIKRDRGARMLL